VTSYFPVRGCTVGVTTAGVAAADSADSAAPPPDPAFPSGAICANKCPPRATLITSASSHTPPHCGKLRPANFALLRRFLGNTAGAQRKKEERMTLPPWVSTDFRPPCSLLPKSVLGTLPLWFLLST